MTPTPPPPALDFAVVRQQCPAAFAAYKTWHLRYTYAKNIQEAPTNPRDLFDFFDQQGVFIRVLFTWYAMFKQPSEWYGEIEINDLNEIIPTPGLPTRAGAEAAAFMAAFERLEGLLTKKAGEQG